jgi:hypothetical protein
MVDHQGRSLEKAAARRLDAKAARPMVATRASVNGSRALHAWPERRRNCYEENDNHHEEARRVG